MGKGKKKVTKKLPEKTNGHQILAALIITLGVIILPVIILYMYPTQVISLYKEFKVREGPCNNYQQRYTKYSPWEQWCKNKYLYLQKNNNVGANGYR